MQQDMAITTVKCFLLSGSGSLAAAAAKYSVVSGAGSLGAQLSITHVYLNLHLPYWVFLVSMVILNFYGAYLSTKTDYMQANGTKLGNLLTAFLVGLILSFVVMPTLSPKTGVGLMQVASFVSGLCGTIFLKVIINVLNRQDLQEAIVELIVSNSIKLVNIAITLAVDHTAKILTALLIGVAASLMYTNNEHNKQPQDSAPQTVEVSND